MKYNFDKRISRNNTDSVKYDLVKPLFGSENILPMWVADMDFEVPEFIREALIMRAEHPVYGYSFRSGRYYESIAMWMEKRHGWKLTPEHIDFSPGVVPALVLCVLAYTKPGDKILVQTPVYFPFFSSIVDHDRVLVNNQLIDQDGEYRMDFEDLERKFKEGVRMMLFCHPHNPVGRVWRKEELVTLAKLANTYDVLILSDEIHSDLVLFGHKHIPFATVDEEVASRTITCIAPSKTFNLAGLHTSAVIIEDVKRKKQYEKILQEIHVGGGNLFGAVALEAAYSMGEEWLEQLLSYLEGNFTFLRNFIDESNLDVRVSPLEATYLAWLNFKSFGLDDKSLMDFMVKEAKLGLSDGPRFGAGGEQYLRMNIAAPQSVIEQALEQMKRAFEKKRK
ncbi:MalY/PatB family protein [Bacteroidota bacterium]